jgi:hypothetical protein
LYHACRLSLPYEPLKAIPILPLISSCRLDLKSPHLSVSIFLISKTFIIFYLQGGVPESGIPVDTGLGDYQESDGEDEGEHEEEGEYDGKRLS